MKRMFIKCMAVVTTVALLAACGQGAQVSTTSSDSAASPDSTSAGESTAPADSADRITLTYWSRFENNAQKSASTYSDLPVYKEYMDRVGINVEFQHPPVGMDEEQFKLLVASKTLPDIIEYDWLRKYPQGPEKALNDQVIIPLNDYFHTDATPYLSAVLTEKPDLDKEIRTYAGNYYGFPDVRADDLMEQKGGGPTIRGDLLDQAGLEIPKTIADWDHMLTTFQGMGVETPFSAADFMGYINRQEQTFVGAFGVGYDFYPIDGVVKFGQIEPEFKRYLELLSDWYSRGLIDPDIITNTNTELDAVMTSGRAAATDRSPDSGIGVWNATMQQTDPDVYFIAAPFPVENEGDTRYHVTPNRRHSGEYTAAITSECKNVEEALRFLDYAYSDEGSLLLNFGVEGVSFEYVDGQPEFTDLIKFNPDGLTLKEAMILYCRNSSGGPFEKAAGPINSQRTYDEQREAPYIWNASIDYSRLLPNLAYTTEEAAEYADIMNEVNVLSEEMVVKIMIGDRSPDDFDSYVENMKSANIERAIEIVQVAYDRYMSY